MKPPNCAIILPIYLHLILKEVIARFDKHHVSNISVTNLPLPTMKKAFECQLFHFFCIHFIETGTLFTATATLGL
jgi:hypothetical protein